MINRDNTMMNYCSSLSPSLLILLFPPIELQKEEEVELSACHMAPLLRCSLLLRRRLLRRLILLRHSRPLPSPVPFPPQERPHLRAGSQPVVCNH